MGSGGRELPGTHRASEKCQPPESRAISEHLTQAHGLAASRKAGKQADMCWKTRSLASLRPPRQAHRLEGSSNAAPGWVPGPNRPPTGQPAVGLPSGIDHPDGSSGHICCGSTQWAQGGRPARLLETGTSVREEAESEDVSRSNASGGACLVLGGEMFHVVLPGKTQALGGKGGGAGRRSFSGPQLQRGQGTDHLSL